MCRGRAVARFQQHESLFHALCIVNATNSNTDKIIVNYVFDISIIRPIICHIVKIETEFYCIIYNVDLLNWIIQFR